MSLVVYNVAPTQPFPLDSHLCSARSNTDPVSDNWRVVERWCNGRTPPYNRRRSGGIVVGVGTTRFQRASEHHVSAVRDEIRWLVRAARVLTKEHVDAWVLHHNQLPAHRHDVGVAGQLPGAEPGTVDDNRARRSRGLE